MITKIQAYFYFHGKFLSLVFMMAIIPFYLLKFYWPQVPFMRFFFIGEIAFFKFLIPTKPKVVNKKVYDFLSSKNLASNQANADYKDFYQWSRDISLIVFALLIFIS